MPVTKTLTYLITPVYMCVFLCALGLLLILFKRKKLGILNIMIGIIWTILWSIPATSIATGGYLELLNPYISSNKVDNAKAIIILGGNTAKNRKNWFKPYDSNTANLRIDRAESLFINKKAQLILLSGAALEGNISDIHIMAKQLESRGIDKKHLIIEDKSNTTYENAVYSANILKEYGIFDVILVTSALHTPRALATLEKQGLNVITAPSPPQIVAPTNSKLFLYSPNLRALDSSKTIIKEYAGLFIYWLRGWI